MSFPDVLTRGNTFLTEYPRTSPLWNYASHFTCSFMTLGAKIVLNTLYNPHIHHIERLDDALAKARAENRSLLTVMNHMSVVDDPSFYAALPWRFHLDIDTIRWGFGAHNICFSTPTLSWFFNLGKILGTKRFGVGPFQGSLDAAIRILSPDDTLDLEWAPGVKDTEKPLLLQEPHSPALVKPSVPGRNVLMASSPFIRTKTSWFHVFPEGFVLQLQKPYNNSMRYFKWGVSRLILEATRAPVVVPIFAYGFEKIAPEDAADSGIARFLPANIGAEVHIAIGEELSEELIESYRSRWRELCEKHVDEKNPTDLSEELKTGKEARQLRSEVAGELRNAVLGVRESLGVFEREDERFREPAYWREYTESEGESDKEVRFVGLNWAIKRLQKHLECVHSERSES